MTEIAPPPSSLAPLKMRSPSPAAFMPTWIVVRCYQHVGAFEPDRTAQDADELVQQRAAFRLAENA